jgi:uncharacterized protein YqjF (DUF2071 family)
MAMLHWLKRHPIPMAAYFRHVLALTYAFPQETLAPLLPPGLVLDTWRGRAFLAVALVQTEQMRPSFLPAGVGRKFFLSGYRIFTRLAGGRSLRGLRILRSDSDQQLMVRAGNLLTHYNYTLCRAEVEAQGGAIRWRVWPPEGAVDLDVTAQVGRNAAALPAGSPFASMAEARRFAGPLPYTFDYEAATRAIIGIRAERQDWNPMPVEVEVRRNAFFEREPFCRTTPVLANAFYVHGVNYQWRRGRRMA